MAGGKKALIVAEICAIAQKAFFFFLTFLFFDKLTGQFNSLETTAHAGLIGVL